MRVAVLLSLAVLIKFFVFPSSLLNVHFATRYFAYSLKTLFCLWLDISSFFGARKCRKHVVDIIVLRWILHLYLKVNGR